MHSAIFAVITTLIHHGNTEDPKIVEELNFYLTSTEPKTRILGLQILGQMINENKVADKGAEIATILTKAMRIKDPHLHPLLKNSLLELGEDAVAPLIDLLKIEPRYIQRGAIRNVYGVSPYVLAAHSIEVMERMDQDIRQKKIVPTLQTLHKHYLSGKNFPGIHDDTKQMVQIAISKLDPNAKPFEQDRINEKHLERTIKGHGWENFFHFAIQKPDKNLIPIIIKQMKNDVASRPYYYGMLLDRIGGIDAIPALVELLSEEDWYPRYAATAGLEMLGQKAENALPKLKERFEDEEEDIEVRVGAARAIASIQGTDPFSLFKLIPNIENKIIKSTRERSIIYRQDFLRRKGAQFDVNETHQWNGSAACVYALASNQYIDDVNVWITNFFDDEIANAKHKFSGLTTQMNLVRAFVMFHSKSRFNPGRLNPEVESRMKEVFFGIMNGEYMKNRDVLSSKDIDLNKIIEMDRHANGPIRWDVFQYLALSVLKDDPTYAQKTFQAGDTVTSRYEVFNTFLKKHLKAWSLWGLWNEFGSSYISRTFSAYFNLVDLSEDPETRKLAKMWIDLTMVEHEQIAISGIRGGSKSRPKKGGLGNSFYCSGEIAFLYGERGVITTGNGQIPNNVYQVPDAAILLRKLGKPTTIYEIKNLHPGEFIVKQRNPGEDATDMIDWGRRSQAEQIRLSHAVNYAYITPDYVIGCAMIDPNRLYVNGIGGRWGGVIFQDLSVVAFEAYSGEKWYVQSKDVIITQRFPETTYHNWPRIMFFMETEKVERNDWIFAMTKNRNAYVAVKIINGGYIWDGVKKDKLYLFKDEYSPVILQVGNSDRHDSFKDFQEAILAAPIEIERLSTTGRVVKVNYTGPNSSMLEFFTRTDPYILPKIDKQEIDLEPKYIYRSPYIENKAGNDTVTIRYGKKQWNYDFSNNIILKK